MTAPFWDRGRHCDRAPLLAGRAKIARAVREWFWAEGFTEVEPTALALSPGAEVHVDAFKAGEAGERYLHTSPEFAMKKLLAAGETRIFFLGKCWRKGEAGPLHTEEFTMLEWYRAGAPYEQVMDDCVALARLACTAVGAPWLTWRDGFADPFAPPQKLTVADAFERFAGVADLLALDREALAKAARTRAKPGETWSDVFSRALSPGVEIALGRAQLTLLYEYPAAEAALARRCAHDPRVAERFEMYACGVELANGFGELTDADEQRARLIEAMDEKERRYGRRWPIDEDFLAALAQMPPASGVALGFDRLVMLATGARHINDVLWTPQA